MKATIQMKARIGFWPLLGFGPLTPPEALVAPYLFFDRVGKELALNAAFVGSAKEQHPDRPIFGVVATSIEFLRTKGIPAVEQAFNRADGLLVWTDDSKDHAYSVDEWSMVGNFVETLSKDGRDVVLMYASEAATILQSKGLAGFASGPGYSESKPRMRAAGGAVPARHYMPDLFRSLTLPDTEVYLNAIKRIPCTCHVCIELGKRIKPGTSGWLDAYCRPTFFPSASAPRGKGPLSPSGDNRKWEARHFIESTAQSREFIQKNSPQNVAMRLRDTYSEIRDKAGKETANYLAGRLLDIAQYLDAKDIR